ncbi:hypothetical protein QBC39DRAFT_346477 [Podospora conica]|nr:hypothetical protein QBC39DRAFT_346477 [Schizothecium conicum]
MTHQTLDTAHAAHSQIYPLPGPPDIPPDILTGAAAFEALRQWDSEHQHDGPDIRIPRSAARTSLAALAGDEVDKILLGSTTTTTPSAHQAAVADAAAEVMRLYDAVYGEGEFYEPPGSELF